MARRALRRRYGRSMRIEDSQVQSLLFPRPRFTVESAREWAERHAWRSDDVDVKDRFIHLRQQPPGRFKAIRTKYFGGSGVQARIGWRK